MFVRGCDKRRHIVGSSGRSARKKHRARVESPLFAPISGAKRKKETAAPGLAINAWPDYCKRDDTVITGRMGEEVAELKRPKCAPEDAPEWIRCAACPATPAWDAPVLGCCRKSLPNNAPTFRIRKRSWAALAVCQIYCYQWRTRGHSYGSFGTAKPPRGACRKRCRLVSSVTEYKSKRLKLGAQKARELPVAKWKNERNQSWDRRASRTGSSY